MTGTPPSEIELSGQIVRRLLDDQHSDLSQLPIHAVDAGWDNAMFRLGEELAVRLPQRAAAAALIHHEHTWLPTLAPRLTLPVPSPVRIGRPALGYPWHWSIVPWLQGSSADLQCPEPSQASLYGEFLRSLHTPAPKEAPANPVRGVPLVQRCHAVEPRLQRLASAGLITPEICRLWNEAVHAPIDARPTWLHGDLHPRNVLVHNGAISGIIDWGDVTAGDPATDLSSIWMLFPEAASRRAAMAAFGLISDATATRAKGWAVLLGVVLLETGLIDNPRHAVLGRRILDQVSEAE